MRHNLTARRARSGDGVFKLEEAVEVVEKAVEGAVEEAMEEGHLAQDGATRRSCVQEDAYEGSLITRYN